MIGRASWIIGLALIACGITALQLDRQSRVSGAVAPYVPGPFRAFAQARLTVAALESDEPKTALKAAETLVGRRPLPAQNLRFLAAAQFRAGRADQSATTIQHAAKRGWRDPLAQEAMMRISLAAGDKTEAAKRFAALMLQAPISDEVLSSAGEPIFGEPGDGRAALTQLVAGTNRWHPAFVRRGLRVLPVDAYIEVLTKAHSRGVIFDCNQLQASLQSIERRQNAPEQADALRDLMRRQCR